MSSSVPGPGGAAPVCFFETSRIGVGRGYSFSFAISFLMAAALCMT
jgi:hypothetical protein